MTGQVFHSAAFRSVTGEAAAGEGRLVCVISAGFVTAIVTWLRGSSFVAMEGVCVAGAAEHATSRVIIKSKRNNFRFTVYLQACSIAAETLSASKDSPEGVRCTLLLVNWSIGTRSHRSR